MYVETNIPVNYDSITYGGQTWIETPSFNYIRVGGEGAQLNIKGDIVTNEEISTVFDGAQLTVTGTITGTIENGFDDSSTGTVNAPSCDNVISSEGSTCNAGPQIVDVDVSDLLSPDYGGAVSASSVLSGYFATIAVVVVVTVVATTATLI